VNGLLVGVGQHQELAEAMCRMVEAPEKAESMGRAAVQLRQQTDVAAITDQWLEIMSSMSS